MEQRMLFRKYRIFDLQQSIEQQAKEAVRALSEEKLADEDQRLIAEIVDRFAPVAPSIDASLAYQTDRQVQVDARRLPNRMVLNRSRPVPVPGTEITIHIPFKGDPGMFDICPSCHTTSWPFAAIDAENSEILLIYQITEGDFPVKARYEEALRDIVQYLNWLKADIQRFESLKQIVQSELTRRRQAASVHSKLVASTGIPRRPDRHAS